MKYYNLATALSLVTIVSACAMAPQRTHTREEAQVANVNPEPTPATAESTSKVEIKDDQQASPISSEEIKPQDPTDASTNVEDVTKGQLSFIDKKYGKNKDTEEQTATAATATATGSDEIAETEAEVTLALATPKGNALKKLNGTAPEKALMYLKHGNVRFLKGSLRKDGQSKKDVKRLAKNEKPHAIIFTTSDSRVSPEIIFDEKLGEIFVVRNFGLSVDNSVINSLEYATQYLGTRLIVVLDRNYSGSQSFSHAKEVIEKIMSKSDVLRNYQSQGQLKITVGIYHLESGKVDFVD